jgi:hypothetical protein
MGSRKRLEEFSGPVEGSDRPEPEPTPNGGHVGVPVASGAPVAGGGRPAGSVGLVERLKRVGVSESIRQRTPEIPPVARPPHQPKGPSVATTLRVLLQRTGVPDDDARELDHRQSLLDDSRRGRGEARRAAAYASVVSHCPVPVHRERVPLPGGLALFDDEFLVATGSLPAAPPRDLTLTTRRLIYSRGRTAQAQLAVYLADICDVAFHADESITVGMRSGRWPHLPTAGNGVVASRRHLLALIDYARQGSPGMRRETAVEPGAGVDVLGQAARTASVHG